MSDFDVLVSSNLSWNCTLNRNEPSLHPSVDNQMRDRLVSSNALGLMVVSFKCDMPHFFKSPRDLTQNGTLEKAQIFGSFFLAITCGVVCLSIASKKLHKEWSKFFSRQ